MSFYYADWSLRSRWIMQMNCQSYVYDGTAGAEPSKKVAFRHHNHEMLELLVMRQGSLRVLVEGREYLLRSGDVVAVNPFRLHFGEWIANGLYNEYICLTVNLSDWLSHKNSALPHEADRLLSAEYSFDELYQGEGGKALARCVETILELFAQKGAAKECLLASEVYRLFGTLFAGHYHGTVAEQVRKRDVEFMKKVTSYLSEHYTEDISTADIAGALFMTAQCFCYTFKRHFGTSFLNYLCQYRITRATELYRERALALSELAATVGFTDYGHFSRSFKKYVGQTPAVYFGKWKESGARRADAFSEESS